MPTAPPRARPPGACSSRPAPSTATCWRRPAAWPLEKKRPRWKAARGHPDGSACREEAPWTYLSHYRTSGLSMFPLDGAAANEVQFQESPGINAGSCHEMEVFCQRRFDHSRGHHTRHLFLPRFARNLSNLHSQAGSCTRSTGSKSRCLFLHTQHRLSKSTRLDQIYELDSRLVERVSVYCKSRMQVYSRAQVESCLAWPSHPTHCQI
mmetsp:Transcript_35521/g.93271  ORF Transcript_35521/g.93271 Transcript_35521/m.93271 type:complete len:208 (-) Transcript_35521:91-714(-)